MQHGRKNVKIWSDNCGGQNRNKYLLAMHMELIKSLPFDSIEHNYLETGHTQMNVDSMHSAIERAAKPISIYTQNEWCNVIRKARAENKKTKTTPYKVIRMQHNDFIDLKDAYSHLMNRSTTDTDNEKIAWLKVKRIRFEKNTVGTIKFKYSHDDNDWKVFCCPTYLIFKRFHPIISYFRAYWQSLVKNVDARKTSTSNSYLLHRWLYRRPKKLI